MKLTHLPLITLLTLTATAMPVDFLGRPILPSLPRDIHTSTLTMRDNVIVEVEPGVYICTGKNWTGNCYWENAVPGYCHQYNLGTSSSFGPDDGLICDIYETNNCKGSNFVPVDFPGLANGLEGNRQSWKCTSTEKGG
jgi:hypothetical protein